MEFQPTNLAGVWRIEPQRHVDERGYFARTFCRTEFERRGLNPCVDQCSVSFNHRRGTLRGMHHQAVPYAEAKLVRVTRGAVYDVALDLRGESPTFRQWVAAELTAENGVSLYIPEGCAHGFVTLADDTEVLYQISVPFCAEAARGVRWNDPAFAIDWPIRPTVINQRDANWPDFRPDPP